MGARGKAGSAGVLDSRIDTWDLSPDLICPPQHDLNQHVCLFEFRLDKLGSHPVPERCLGHMLQGVGG